ncbi:MAG: hypothetical protein KAH99_02625 [Verrucomicrobia bacterium]|nr:hypothetical protein [Verrucomicrobiota bacterium]
MNTRGKVPVFTLKPHPGVSLLFILVVIGGLLTAMSFFSMEEGTGEYRQRGILTLVFTAILGIFLTIVATSKMWFPHLWKKNSTHSRHKKHTQYHPTVKEHEFRKHH